MKFQGIIFGIDFDGTCVYHKFPEVGDEVPGAVETLRWVLSHGGKLVLNTMRSGSFLMEAVAWFDKFKIDLYGINENPTQKKWTTSPKVYANYYIDDAALGTPLHYDEGTQRFCVDWRSMRRILEVIIPEAEPIHGQ